MDKERAAQPFRLLDLPAELIDNILSHVPLHLDLLNFALTSRLCSSIAIPRHTEYRVVHFESDDRDSVWTHLTRRPDLACNIREIHVLYDEAPDEFLSGPSSHYPLSLLDRDLVLSRKPTEEVHEDLLMALGSMTRLERVHWNWVPTRSKDLLMKVLDKLKIPTMKHLSLNPEKDFFTDSPLSKHPLWALSSLESLSLEGSAWSLLPRSMEGEIYLIRWFQRLSTLQFLRIEAGSFLNYATFLYFPNLRGLDLRDDINGTELEAVKFLQSHPTIEELTFYPRRLTFIPEGFLPNLKRLATLPAALLDMETWLKRWEAESAGYQKWDLEYLHLSEGGWGFFQYQEETFVEHLCDLTCLDPNALRFLALGIPGTVSAYVKLAKTFPMIEELFLPPKLNLPGRKATKTCSFIEMFYVYPHFRNLRVIHGNSIWADIPIEIHIDNSRMETEEYLQKYCYSAMDPVTNFTLTACTEPKAMFLGKWFSNIDHKDGYGGPFVQIINVCARIFLMCENVYLSDI